MTYFKIPNLLKATAALAVMSLAPNTFAQQECGDQTCEEGFDCASFTGLCRDVDCEGPDCEPCEEQEFFYCEAAACESDDECGDYMVCATLEEYDCSNVKDSDCAPDEPCEEPVEECDVLEVQRCSAPWDLPCDADADCGDGFTCEPHECGCTSAGGAAASGGGDGDSAGSEDPATSGIMLADGGDCVCDLPDGGWCKMVEQTCEEDSDCPDSWSCQERGDTGCWADSEGNTNCDSTEPEMVCAPPGYAGGLPVTAELDSAASSGAAGVPEVAATGVDGEEGDPTSEDLPVMDLEDVDESAQSGAADQDDEEPAIAELGNDNDAEEDGSTSKSSSGGGCTVASTSGAGSADLMAMLAALGAAMTLRRRRERRS